MTKHFSRFHRSLWLIPIVTSILTLSACSTLPGGPCLPNPDDMKKAQPLPPILEEKLSQRKEVETHLGDEREYNDLAVHNNNLIDHVLKYCQA